MKVLHICYYASEGGAARACHRLNLGLRNLGVDSEVVSFDNIDDYLQRTASSRLRKFIWNPISRLVDRLILRLYPRRKSTPFSINFFQSALTADVINIRRPDIIHIHWIGQGFLSPSQIRRINAPIVWTVHDDWALTGGCHIAGDCMGFTSDCMNCKYLDAGRSSVLSNFLFTYKKKNFSRCNSLTFIALSTWMMNRLSLSDISRLHSIKRIPNPIESTKFLGRRIENYRFDFLDPKRKCVLFGALNATSDPNKGFDLLVQAANLVSNDFQLVVFGANDGQIGMFPSERCVFIGNIDDDAYLSALYSNADVVAVPSRQESFGQVALESLLSGTPVVCFDGTGMDDFVEHKVNGYRAEMLSVADFAHGIEYCLMGNIDREMVKKSESLNNFRSVGVVSSYVELYRQLIKSHSYS
jgi:glycosyltransferase involved in cell wall biosynthesis